MGNEFSGYEAKKEKLIAQIRQGSADGAQPIALNKSTSNLFRPHDKGKNVKKLDVKCFNRVLNVDKEQMVAEVEGMTTYEDLVNETLKHDCLPTVVPELKSITIGGALSGCGIESSSFRYGLVHESIVETEILLGDGTVLVCNAHNENQDLFFAFPNTYGTLGYALKVKVRLIPIKKYVKLTHLRFSEASGFFETLGKLCAANKEQDPYTYLEGVIFSGKEMYIIAGEFVDEAPYTHDYHYRNIYYRSIATTDIDYLPTLDYIWRWDPDWFWCSKVFFMENPILRLLFGKWMLSSKVYAKIMHFFNRHAGLNSFLKLFQGKKESVIQDVLIPASQAQDFLAFFLHEVGIQPIWICPTQCPSKTAHYVFCPLEPNMLYLDFGFWDSIPTTHEEGYYNREIERKVKDAKGFKSLYSSSYYTEEEFWSLYNHPLYLKLKQKYDPKGLLKNLYEKCVKRKT